MERFLQINAGNHRAKVRMKQQMPIPGDFGGDFGVLPFEAKGKTISSLARLQFGMANQQVFIDDMSGGAGQWAGLHRCRISVPILS